MRKLILGLPVVFLAIAAAVPAEAGGKGWGASRGGAGWGKVHHAYRTGLHGGAVAVGDVGDVGDVGYGGRYLSDSSWYLSDIGGYLADGPSYPAYGYGYDWYPAYAAPARQRSSYAVAVQRTLHGPRVVTLRHGTPKRFHRRR